MLTPRTCTKWYRKNKQNTKMYQECIDWEIFLTKARKFVSSLDQRCLEKLAAMTETELMQREAEEELSQLTF